MKNTTISGSTTCTSHITKKKNRLKIYENDKSKSQVFLNDKDEFEIELYNPKTAPVLAKISLNGKLISDRGVILYPGKRVFLERFIESPEKFSFSTYQVKRSNEVKKAIANNGLVKVEFFDEALSINYINLGSCGYGYQNYHIYNYPYSIPIPTTGDYNLTGSSIPSSNLSSIINCNSSNNSIFGVGSTSGSYTLTSNNFVAGPLNEEKKFSDISDLKNTKNIDMETGRVSKGEKSSQNFSSADINFNSYSFLSIEYQIIPISEKPVEIGELRTYCTECGTKNKQGWKFCPTCGSKI